MIRLLFLVISIVGIFTTYPLIGFNTDSVSYWAVFLLLAFTVSAFTIIAKIMGINGKVKGGDYDFPMDD